MAKMVSKKSKPKDTGRPTKYQPEYAELMLQYFMEGKKIHEDPKGFKKEKEYKEFPTFEGFANFILNVSKRTLENWRDEYEDFFRAYTQCKEIQEHILLQGGLNRAYDGRFAMFLLNSVSKTYREKIEHTVDDSAKNLIRLAYSLPQKTKDE